MDAPEPTFLSVDEIVAIHADQVRRYGGSPEMRDRGLLESAVAMPAAAFGGQYAHPDIHDMAAAYLFHLAQNHPFIDGNKRVAAVAASVFLRFNDWELTASSEEFYQMTLAVADGSADKAAAAAFFRRNNGRV